MPDTVDNTPPPEGEISFLDLLGTVTENLRLLILGPIVVGLLGLGIAFILPPTFESRMVLRFDGDKGLSAEAVLTLSQADDVLIALLPSAPWVDQTGSRTAALIAMRNVIQPNHNKRDNTFSVNIKAPSAAQAQALGQALLAQLREKSRPKGKALAELQEQKNSAQATLAELDKLMPILAKQLTAKPSEADVATRTYTQLLERRDQTQRAISTINTRVEPFGEEVIVQAPTLPDKAVSPKKGLIAAISALAAGFGLLLFVFVRQAIRNAAQNPDDAERLAAIKDNLARSLFMGRDRPKA